MMTLTKSLVKKILEHPESYEWSLQGFGQLRLYLSKEIRLHVWSGKFQYIPQPDPIHDHPWDFESEVIAGSLLNVRYAIGPSREDRFLNYKKITIQCGPGGKAEPGYNHVYLFAHTIECIEAGNGYKQHAEEIHESIPAEGSVSVITRRFLADTEHAHVFVPRGKEFTSAEPLKAEPGIAKIMCDTALERYF